MKILQVIHDFLPRHAAGSEIYSYKLAKELVRRGHEVHLYFTEVDRTVPQYSLREGLFDGLPYYEAVNNHRFNSFEETYRNPAMDGLFEKVLERVSPDVVHIQHLLNHSLNYIRIAKNKNLPVVFTLHDYWLTCPLGGQRITKDLAICHGINASECARCISRYSKNSLRLKRVFDGLVNRFAAPGGYDLVEEADTARVYARHKGLVRKGEFAIEGEAKTLLLAHPPSSIRWGIKIPGSPVLSFSLGMNPDTYSKYGEGVRFKVMVNGDEVFSKYIDPKNEPEDRKWHTHSVSLDKYAGRKVSLELVTEPGPGGKAVYCACGWGDVRISQNGGKGTANENLAKRTYMRLRGILDRVASTGHAAEVTERLDHVREVSMYADLFIAPSRFLREKFIEFGIPGEKITYSDYGFDTGGFAGHGKKRAEKIRFGYIGSLVPHKGVHVLVDAFSKIKDPKAELKIYGELDWYPDYVARLKKLNGNPNVHFMGGFDNSNVAAVLSGIDVLVVPSVWYENSPLTIHEAFLSKTPVVASDLGGMAELVEDGKSGLLFKVGDPEDLREKLETIIKSPGLLEKFTCEIPPVKGIEEDARDMEERYRRLLGPGLTEGVWAR